MQGLYERLYHKKFIKTKSCKGTNIKGHTRRVLLSFIQQNKKKGCYIFKDYNKLSSHLATMLLIALSKGVKILKK